MERLFERAFEYALHDTLRRVFGRHEVLADSPVGRVAVINAIFATAFVRFLRQEEPDNEILRRHIFKAPVLVFEGECFHPEDHLHWMMRTLIQIGKEEGVSR